MNVYAGPVGSTDPSEWRSIGWLIDDHAVFQSELVPDNRIVWQEPRSASVSFTMSTEMVKRVKYWIACDLIKSQMRQDLEDLLEAFATRWGLAR